MYFRMLPVSHKERIKHWATAAPAEGSEMLSFPSEIKGGFLFLNFLPVLLMLAQAFPPSRNPTCQGALPSLCEKLAVSRHEFSLTDTDSPFLQFRS